MASSSGWLYFIVYTIAFIVGAAIGLFLDFEGSRWESALIFGIILAAATFIFMDWGLNLFADGHANDGWAWLYWTIYFWVGLSLLISGGLIAFKHHMK